VGGKSTFPHSTDDKQRARSRRRRREYFGDRQLRNLPDALETVDTYIGRYDYKLARSGKELKIRERRAILDNEALRPHGKISFIL
jgi:Ring hydroxylating beta subunit